MSSVAMFSAARRPAARTAHSRARTHRPNVEGLEDRFLLYAATGGHWQFPARITYSFVPDGTSLGGIPSTLNSSLSALGISASSWQTAITKAALAWEATAGVNLVQVGDNGAVSGDPTLDQQGDPNVGDIRFGGTSLDPSVLAEAFLPPPINGGSLAGDVVFNTSQLWKVGADYDFQTVAMHEFGHALGLDHSTDTTATMYPYYTGTNQVLAADDKAGIQAVYGPRQPDAFDAAASNQTTATASNITPYIDPSNLQISLSGLDISTNQDLDVYKVVVPAGASSSFTVKMQSTGLSSMSPRLLVLNGTGGFITQVYSSNYGATVSATINGVSAGQTYYFRAQGYATNTAGIGAYGLQVNFSLGYQAPIAPPNTTVAAQADHGGGGSYDQIGGDPLNFHTTLQIGDISGTVDTLTIGSYRHRPITEHQAATSRHAVHDHALATVSRLHGHHHKAHHRKA